MRKSLKREYEQWHTYDFADFDTMKGRRFTKKVSHKRVRRVLNNIKNDKENDDGRLQRKKHSGASDRA